MRKWIVLTVLPVFFFLILGCASKSAQYEKFAPEDVKMYDEARALFAEGAYEKAQKMFGELLDEYPDSTMKEAAMYYNARCYKEMGDAGKARSMYRELVAESESGIWGDSAKSALDKMNSEK